VNYSLNDAYDDGTTITVDSTAVTLTGSHATNATLAISGAGTGALIALTQASTGADVTGTGSTWSVSAAGAAVFTAITGCDTLTAAGNLAIDATGAGTIKLGDTSTGTVTIEPALVATASVTITGAAASNKLTVTAGDVSVADGSVTIVDDDNAASLSVTNSAATSAAGVVTFLASAVTSGTLLNLSLDESALNAGYFLRCIQTDAAATKFSIAENGATVIAGNAEGTAALTLTAGDLVLTDGALIITAGAFTYTAGDMAMGDGSLTIVDADNAATLSVTNSTATSESPFALIGAGAFTGTTTKSWLTLTAAGLTTGTQVYVAAAALTQGKMLHLASGATQTTGSLLFVQETGAESALTSGTIATFDHTATAITATVNKIGNGVTIASSRTTTTGTVADDYDLASIARTQIINGAGAMTATGSVLYVRNITTNTSGTITDTVKGIELVMDADGTGTALDIAHSGVASAIVASCAIATGTAVSITANALTTGTGLLVTSSGTIATTGELVSLVANGATSATAVLRISATALTSGWVAEWTGGAGTFTNAGGMLNLQMGAATDGCGINITTSGIYAGTVGLIDINATQTTTGTIIDILNEGRTTGDVLKITTNTTGTGNYIHCYDGAATDFKVSRYGAVTIAGNAIGTAALTVSAGDAVVTSGNIEITTGHIKNTPQAIAAGENAAISIVTLGTTIANNAASTHTLADGSVGQLKYITCITYVGDAVITPTNFVGTTITLNAAGDSWLGVFAGTEWRTIALGGTAAVV